MASHRVYMRGGGGGGGGGGPSAPPPPPPNSDSVPAPSPEMGIENYNIIPVVTASYIKYRTAGNFHQFYHLLSSTKMATITTLAKILSLESYYNTKIAGLAI